MKRLLIDASVDCPSTEDTATVASIIGRPCRIPVFRNQRILQSPGNISLDAQNSIMIAHNFLNCEDLRLFIQGAATIRRYGGKSAYNSIKPRREVCYSSDDKPFRYSKVEHKTRYYPQHILQVLPKMMGKVNKEFPTNKYNSLSNGIDILYSSEFARGGGAGAHGDNEKPWGLVLIYSLGQTRWLRVRRKSDRAWYNVEMKHNSLVAMHGDTFQWDYTHQVDRLSESESVFPRLSCNFRFLEGHDNLAEVTEHCSQLVPSTSPLALGDSTNTISDSSSLKRSVESVDNSGFVSHTEHLCPSHHSDQNQTCKQLNSHTVTPSEIIVISDDDD